MATWLGAFPFPSLAPSILTIEALLKVIVIMTERYGKVLKRGKADRNKLLFRSLAVYDRRMSSVSEKPKIEVGSLSSDQNNKDENHLIRQHATGFPVDLPVNDDEEDEDDDELALAALDSLDAIEVFKQDQRDTKINHAQIPVDNFRSLLMLLIIIAPLDAQENLSKHAERMTDDRIEGLRCVADSILWSFTPEEHAGISYRSFNTIVPASLPFMFDGLNPLFEHFLFSKNLDLTKHRRKSSASSPPSAPTSPTKSTSNMTDDASLEPLMREEGAILNLSVLSQLSFFLKGSTIFRRLRSLYMGTDAGFSMGSIEQKVFNWRAPTILLVSGTRLPAEPDGATERQFADSLPPKRFPNSARGNSQTDRVVYGVYLDVPWKNTHKDATGGSDAVIFQLEPIHEVFRASALSKHYMTFTKDGVAFGNPPPRRRSISGFSPGIELGAVSLMLDPSLEYGVFNHDVAGGGSFYPSSTRKRDWQDRFEIESLEIWGCGGDEEAERQRKAWEFEEREAVARRGIRRGKDVESDRALLEMAGLVGNHNASGGSMA